MLTFSINRTSEEVMGAISEINYHGVNSEMGRQWMSEAYLGYLDGRVAPGTDVAAYGAGCEKNTQLAKANKEIPFVTLEEYKEGKKGVTEAVAQYKDLNITSILDSAEAKYNAEKFVEMHKLLEVEKGVNLWGVLKKALAGSEFAIKMLRGIVEEEEYGIGEILQSILGDEDSLGGLDSAIDTVKFLDLKV